jgi:hypothetical protein
MGSSIDPASLRQFAPALRAGSVLHLYDPVAGKPKYHVVIVVSAERSLGFIINSRPSPFIQRQPELLRRQVPMLLQEHPFMRHDSVIACHDTVKLPTRDVLIEGLLHGVVDHLGRIHQTLFGQIAAAAAGSALIAERDSALIVQSFGR